MMKTSAQKWNTPSQSLPGDESNEKKNDQLIISGQEEIPVMTEIATLPPSRVWEKIERILDEQEERRNYGNTLIANSFANSKNSLKSKHFYIAAVAGISLLAGLFRYIR